MRSGRNRGSSTILIEVYENRNHWAGLCWVAVVTSSSPGRGDGAGAGRGHGEGGRLFTRERATSSTFLRKRWPKSCEVGHVLGINRFRPHPGSGCDHYLCTDAAEQESGAGHFLHSRHGQEHRAASAEGDAGGAGVHDLSRHDGRRPAGGAGSGVRPGSGARFPSGVFPRTGGSRAIRTARWR